MKGHTKASPDMQLLGAPQLRGGMGQVGGDVQCVRAALLQCQPELWGEGGGPASPGSCFWELP